MRSGRATPASSTSAAFIPRIVVDVQPTRATTTRRAASSTTHDRAYLRLPRALALRAAQREPGRAAASVSSCTTPTARTRATLRLWDAVRDSAYAAPPSSRLASQSRRGRRPHALVSLCVGQAAAACRPRTTRSPRRRASRLRRPARGGERSPEAAARRPWSAHGFVALPEEWWHYDYARLGALPAARRRPRRARRRPAAGSTCWLPCSPRRAGCGASGATAAGHGKVTRDGCAVRILRAGVCGFCAQTLRPPCDDAAAAPVVALSRVEGGGTVARARSSTCRSARRTSSTRRRSRCWGAWASPTTRPRRIDLLEQAGAQVDRETLTARLTWDLIEPALKTVPKTVLLAGRDSSRDRVLGERPLVTTSDGMTTYMLDDLTGERRDGTHRRPRRDHATLRRARRDRHALAVAQPRRRATRRRRCRW